VIALLFALAVAAFVLSLPIAKTALGAKLRQIAGVCFVLALLPSIVIGLFFPARAGGPGSAPPGGAPSSFDQLAAGLSCLGAFVLLSLIAYGVLSLRKRLSKPKKEPWEMLFSRGRGKRRVERESFDDHFIDREGW
jgi:hypothetical protein